MAVTRKNTRVATLILKIFGGISAFFALLAFGSDFLPVESVSLGGYESPGGTHQFYKIVTSEGADPTKVGIVLLLMGIISFSLPTSASVSVYSGVMSKKS